MYNFHNINRAHFLYPFQKWTRKYCWTEPGQKCLCSFYRIRYNNCRVLSLFFVCKSLCSQMHRMSLAIRHLFYFQRVLLQIKMWAGPLRAFFFSSLNSIVCVLVWDRHKSAGKMKATKCCAMLSSRMHESKDWTKAACKNGIQKSTVTQRRSHNYTLAKLWKIKYSRGIEWSWKR